jgi:hypothetical protein
MEGLLILIVFSICITPEASVYPGSEVANENPTAVVKYGSFTRPTTATIKSPSHNI